MGRFVYLFAFLFALASSQQIFADDGALVVEDQPKKPYDLHDLSVTTRYRMQSDRDAENTQRLQLKINLDMSLLFFKEKVQVNFQGGTGARFGSAWSDTGIGDADRDLDLALRRLSVTFEPADVFGVEIGSMAPLAGVGTDNTSLDSDGWITGYRARVTISDAEITMTGGYLGDFSQPNVFARLDRMDELNYFQVQLQNKLSEILSASLDYQYFGEEPDGPTEDSSLIRGAIKLDVAKWTTLLDSLKGEYGLGLGEQESDSYGLFAVTGQKNFSSVESLGGRPAKISVSYLHRTDDVAELPIPIEDKGFAGSSYRLQASILDLFNGRGRGKWSTKVDWTQSLEDCDEWRCEVSLGWEF